MRQKLYEAIETAITSGVPPSMVPDVLIRIGWPLAAVNQAFGEWWARNARRNVHTDFRTWLKKYQHRAMPSVILVVLLGLGQAVFTLLKPWPLKIMADSALNTLPAPGPLQPYTHQPKLIAILAIMSLVIFLVATAFSWFSDFALLRIGFWLNRSIKAESLRHILHLPLYHQQRLAKGDYVYRQNVVTNSLADLVLGSTASIATSIIMILGILAIMLQLDVRLTIVSVLLMPLLYLAIRMLSPKLSVSSRRLSLINSKTASMINEAVDNAETVQAFTLEEKQLLHVHDLWDASYKATRQNLFWSNILKNTNSLLVVMATSVTLYIGGIAALKHQITFGELYIFMTYMNYMLSPVQNLVQRTTSRMQKVADVSRVYEILSDHEGIEDLRRTNLFPPDIQGSIEFQNVSYSYNGQPVFTNLSMHINRGEKVAIIGPSGSGKSTFLKLLPLFVEPQNGTILIDGVDTQSVSLQNLRQKIAWVSQSPQLFSSSIIENMYDGDIYRPVSLDEIKYALATANVLEFTAKLPLGVNSPAGENGTSLSGGQRQRVAIARALIKNAPILCLDEPTAALDTKSENYIRDSLMQMVRNKTVLMVTHRKALLALMDTVYVLDNGGLRNVIEFGGLDAYLAQLEGLNQQQIAQEIEEDKWYASSSVTKKRQDIQQANKPVARTVPEADIDSISENKTHPKEAPSTKQIFAVEQNPEDAFVDDRNNSGGVVHLHQKDDSESSDEVVIRLR